MAITSEKLEIGSACPDFELDSVDNKKYRLSDFKQSKGLLVAFICRHCPYVLAIEDRLLQLAHSYEVAQLQTVAICSNDAVQFPEDGPKSLLQRWQEKNYQFPYLVDEDQMVAKEFDAACTPDLYLYDQNRRLFYHGRLDDNWKEPAKVTSYDLKQAVDALLSDQDPPENQKPTMGCSIKWK